MPVEYKDFHRIAEASLATAAVDEISCRTAVSRGYYGLFHAALTYADEVRLPPVSALGGRTHEKLRVFFQIDAFPDPDLVRKHRRIGYILKQLHDLRVLADYKLEETITPMTARTHVTRCQEITSEVESLTTPGSAVQSKMKIVR